MTGNKYRVIKRLEAGGMAEVFYGEAKGVQGFKKRVAIKRVLPHLAQNENFIQMFLDEARLSARLNHANIVSVFDIEPWQDTYQLIMEFVDGANLKRIMDSLHTSGHGFPLGEAAYICMEACRGLSYAHELIDESGTPLGIVHRDISPPNIMVTQRGEVKVADFGLAKAGTQLSQTDPGVVKGKFGYLSPEAAEGHEVDARADIFSLGIVLWEMLAGRRLFLGESDYATVKLVQKANVPRLSPLNSDVDEGFEEVLMRALMRDPEQRYRSAQEFGDALADYLFTRQLKVTSYDLATLVKAATTGEATSSSGSKESSLIHRLIQHELDEDSHPSGVGMVAEEDPGTPLPGDYEDPASWFSDEELAPAGRMPALVQKQSKKPPNSGSWREAGLDAAELFESDSPEGELDELDLIPPSSLPPPLHGRSSQQPSPSASPSHPQPPVGPAQGDHSNPPTSPPQSQAQTRESSLPEREDDTAPTIITSPPTASAPRLHVPKPPEAKSHATTSKAIVLGVVAVAIVALGALAFKVAL